MTQKHTPEPWVRSSEDFIAAESDQLNNGEYILSCFGPDQAANARRIVACVNACEGIGTECLESMPINKSYLDAVCAREEWETRAIKESSRAADLQAQVDELLELLKSLENDAGQIPQFMWTKIQNAVKKHTGETK